MIGLLIYYDNDLEKLYKLLDSIEEYTTVPYKVVILADNIDVYLGDKYHDCIVINTNFGDKYQAFNRACQIIDISPVCFLTENCEILLEGWLKALQQDLVKADLVAPMLYTLNKETNTFWGDTISLWEDNPYSSDEEDIDNECEHLLSEQEKRFMDPSIQIFPLGFIVDKHMWMDIGGWCLEPPCMEFKTLNKVLNNGWNIEKVPSAKILVEG